MTMYQSSPSLKKVLSEQFLNQLKCKTEVDNIKWQYQTLLDKESRANNSNNKKKKDSGPKSAFKSQLKNLVDNIQ